METEHDKHLPETTDERTFKAMAAAEDPDRPAEKFIMSRFAGLAPLIAREIVYRAAGKTDATMREAERDLTEQFFRMIRIIREPLSKNPSRNPTATKTSS